MNQLPLSPRLSPPEFLTGVPEKPEIEISPQRPWLTVAEVNRLIRQQGLALAVAQAWILDEIVNVIELPADLEKSLIRKYLETQSVNSDEEMAKWLDNKRISFKDLRCFATKAERLKQWQLRRYGDEAEIRFLERKLELDHVVYSMLRLPNQDLAEELYYRIKHGEADFSNLAEQFSQGKEKNTRGLIGPIPLAAGHPDLTAKLRIGKPNQMWQPFKISDMWIVLRFEKLLPAKLDQSTRNCMVEELFQAWFKERVQLLMDGEPLPPLPFLPAIELNQ